MNFLQSKKGVYTTDKIQNMVFGAIIGFVGFVVLVKVVASLFPTLVTAGAQLNSSGLPIVGDAFATSSSYGWVVLGASLLIALLVLIFSMMSHKGK